MPAERQDFCPHCGTAPCRHPHQGLDWSDPSGVAKETGWLLLLAAVWLVLVVILVAL